MASGTLSTSNFSFCHPLRDFLALSDDETAPTDEADMPIWGPFAYLPHYMPMAQAY